MTVKEAYITTLQNFQYVPDIQASTWTFRTIRDLKSVGKRTQVLTTGDKAAMVGRGALAIFLWLPVNLIAIPHVFIVGALQRRRNRPAPMPQLHEILPQLYLGTEQAAKNAAVLQEKNITAVLSILDYEIVIPEQVQQYRRIPLEDYPHVDLASAVSEAIHFVELARSENRSTLVHCNMGKSRSASIMVALVHKIQECTPLEAYNRVCEHRPVVGLNYGFKKQVLQLPLKDDEGLPALDE